MDELSAIGLKYVTDKTPVHHSYTPIYDKYFNRYRNKEFVFIEGGIGGYSYNDRGGGSLSMWREYFTKAKIYGFDLYDKSGLNLPGIEIFKGDQTDKEFLTGMIKKTGAPNIFIDDLSHKSDLTIQTFEIVFPLLEPGGIYVVEDCHTSYWNEEWKGKQSIIEYFKQKIDDIHLVENYPIKAIHFYNKLVFVFK